MLGSALCFSLMVVCVRAVGPRIPLAEVVLVRALVSVALSAWLLWRARIPPLGRRRGLLMIRGVLGTAALVCVYAAVVRLPMATATVLQYLYPTLTAALAWLLLGERLGPGLLLAMLLGWLGVLVIAAPGASLGGPDPLGLGLALAGALLTALAYVAVRQLGRSEHPLVIVLYFPLMAIPLMLPAVLLDPVWPTAREAAALLGVGLFTQLGQIGLTQGLTALPAARATALSYAQVVFAALWGWLFFAEPVDLRTGFGAVLVLAATLLNRPPGAPPPRGARPAGAGDR
ncbi:MAG: DMT family transporter [Synechococcaceae cyanobacterium]|nr:DMT family transporter [Synechococcaceae cyanobacterium]